MQTHAVLSSFSSSESWSILSDIEYSIKTKIETVGTPLRDWNIQINYGIKTGFNDAFIIDSIKRKEILESCSCDEERQRTADIIRPILRGRDIKRYGNEWANLYLIATFPARHYDIELYPAIKNHLLSFAEESLIEDGHDWIAKNHLAEYCQKKLEQTGQDIVIDGQYVVDPQGHNERSRKKTSNKWFETQDNISYWDLLSQPKIIWGEISDKSKFCLDIEGAYYPEATTFMLSGERLSYLLAFLNCNVSEYFFSLIGTTTGVGTVRWKKYKIMELPVPNTLPNEICDRVIQLSDDITQNGSVESIKDLNSLIYNIYELNQKEVDYIEFHLR